MYYFFMWKIVLNEKGLRKKKPTKSSLCLSQTPDLCSSSSLHWNNGNSSLSHGNTFSLHTRLWSNDLEGFLATESSFEI